MATQNMKTPTFKAEEARASEITRYVKDLFNQILVDWQFEDSSIPLSKIIGLDGAFTPLLSPIKNITSDYELIPDDLGYLIRADTSGGNIEITLPDGFDTGWQVVISNVGTGIVTLTADTTLNAQVNTISVQYAASSVVHIGSNIWEAYGDLS